MYNQYFFQVLCMFVQHGTLLGLENINHKCLKVVFMKIFESKYAAQHGQINALFYVTRKFVF